MTYRRCFLGSIATFGCLSLIYGSLRKYKLVLPLFSVLLLFAEGHSCHQNPLNFFFYLYLGLSQPMTDFMFEAQSLGLRQFPEDSQLKQYSMNYMCIKLALGFFKIWYGTFSIHHKLLLKLYSFLFSDIIIGFRHRITFDMLYRLHPRDKCKALLEASKKSMKDEDKR